MQTCLKLAESYQEQYEITKEKLAATPKGNRPEEQKGIGVPSDQIFTPECVSSVCDRNPDEGIQASDSGTSSAA